METRSKEISRYFNLVLILCIGLCVNVKAQNIFIGKNIALKGSAVLFVSGNFTTNSTAVYVNDATVEVKGDVSNAKPTMTQGTGTTKFTGTATQTISGVEPFVVNNFIVNNTSLGTNNILVNKNLIIGSSATFTDGILKSATDSVTFNLGTTYSGASDVSHVDGIVNKIGNEAFTFPVGDSLKLRPAAIDAPSILTDVFKCKYIRATPTPGTMGSGIIQISTSENWLIYRTSGSSNPLVTLSYDATYSGTITAVADLRVANLSADEWIDIGGTGVAGLVTSTVIPLIWGEFTLGSSSTSNTLPIKLLDFEAKFNTTNNNVELKWITANEINSDYFTIERSTNGNEWEVITLHEAAGNSETVLDYNIIDETPNNGINYYRLKETDFNGDYFYSNIKFIKVNTNVAELSIYPNPIITNATLNYSINNDEEFELEITNSVGQVVINKKLTLQKGENTLPFEMEGLNPGNYFLNIHTADYSKIETRKLIKLN